MGNLGSASTEPIHLPFLVLNLVAGLILAFILSSFYRRFSSTISNRRSMTNVFYFVILATTLIIMIVKTSIALSLGLVGALSIVRFRTPIREPEDLGFLFLAVATGVGLGANQTTAVVVAFCLILAILGALYWYRSKNIVAESGVLVNINIPFDGKPGFALDKLSDQVSAAGENYDIKRIELIENKLTAVFSVLPKTDDSLSILINQIEGEFPGSRVAIINDVD